MRRLGLAGRVLRDVAWPGNPVTDLRIAAEAAEEVLAGGLVVFSTTCGVVSATRLRCTRAGARVPQPRRFARSATSLAHSLCAAAARACASSISCLS